MVARDRPGKVVFTHAGSNAEFLRLDDSAAESKTDWRHFDGIFACYPARKQKLAATVFARFADPEEDRNVEGPIFMAANRTALAKCFTLAAANCGG